MNVLISATGENILVFSTPTDVLEIAVTSKRRCGSYELLQTDCVMQVLQTFHSYLELRQCFPRLKKLLELLRQSPYKGAELESVVNDNEATPKVCYSAFATSVYFLSASFSDKWVTHIWAVCFYNTKKDTVTARRGLVNQKIPKIERRMGTLSWSSQASQLWHCGFLRSSCAWLLFYWQWRTTLYSKMPKHWT